jgi:hypothetical protein
MATTSNTGGRKPATTRKSTPRKTTAAATRKTTAATTRRTSSSTSSTQPKTAVGQAQEFAELAVHVPLGASLLVRENLVSTAKDLATKYSTRTNLERELKRYERRGVTARNRFERQVRKSRTRFERELRQRRSRVERTVKQNRRRFEREVRTVRKDLGRSSTQLTNRVEKLLASVS